MTKQKPHRHHKAMLRYAQDAGETSEPWLRWQYKQRGYPFAWDTCRQQPDWDGYSYEYRRKTMRLLRLQGHIPSTGTPT